MTNASIAADTAPAGGEALRGDRREYLDAAVSQLWPQRPVSRRRGATGESYVLIPRRSRPTVLVPRRPRRATAAALRNYKASGGVRTQALLTALSIGARLGLADLLAQRLTISDGPGRDSILTYLRRVLGRQVVIALYTSPPRANRKPVLQVLTPQGQTYAFAKIGTTALTRGLVASEAAALARLSRAPLKLVEPPALLHHGRWEGHEVLVQRALPRSGGPGLATEDLAAAMLEVASVDGVIEVVARRSTYAARLAERVDALPPSAASVALAEALATLTDSGALEATLRLGCWHGDWTPWNMTTDGRRARVWDWERFEGGVPLGFDALHYEAQGAIVRAGVDPATGVRDMVQRAAALLEPFEVEPEGARLTALLYLIDLGARYLHDGQAEAGSTRGRLETWLLPALCDGVEAIAHAGSA